jgi:hypothetical protein
MNAPKINAIPYVVFAAALPLIVFSIPALIFSGIFLHTSDWWVLIAVPFGTALIGYFLALARLRRRGLPRSTTMAEFGAAIDQKVSGRQE